jgi:hypothetical protein
MLTGKTVKYDTACLQDPTFKGFPEGQGLEIRPTCVSPPKLDALFQNPY